MTHDMTPEQARSLRDTIRGWGEALGFTGMAFAAADLGMEAEQGLMAWLAAGYQGDMDYMARHGSKRARPTELVPGTVSVISVRLDYLPDAAPAMETLEDPALAYVSRYALGRDYHKLMRNRLQRLADRITREVGPFQYRAFSDSAPVMEVALAARAGLGWRGKHTLLLTRQGSWFFLGELLTDLPLPADPPASSHCGRCQACIEACPTGAILEPYVLDARRCISYLTIEHQGAIPVELRALIGNRIYGCDDCQLFCPWNRHASPGGVLDFEARNQLDQTSLLDLFAWREDEFEQRLSGSAIRRIGHEKWLRNLAVALGNSPPGNNVVVALQERLHHPSALVREHVEWAISRQMQRLSAQPSHASSA